jgi:ligand-binding sensor protein/biotin operon repressor
VISAFNIEKLQDLLKDFYQLSRIRITVFDENMNELVAYPRQVAPYCAVIRESAQGLQACQACDRKGCRDAGQKKKTCIYRCHAGLTEAAAPLYMGDVLIGYLLFGHVFPYRSHSEGFDAILSACQGYGINREKLRKAVAQAVPLSEEYVRSAAHILHAVASYLILERMATLKEDMLEVRLDTYVSAHCTEPLSAAALAERLGIGRTQLYELSKKLYQQGLAAHIRTLRMEKAKSLLRQQRDLSLAEVAWQCGYQDYNYFFTVFRREVGCTPREWKNGHDESLIP